jgi:hypothetical protein
MVRPAASRVSALSGFVANGRQAVHPVSPSPSKIPYGGFSPVRLQAGCQPRPSPTPVHPASAYTQPQSSVRPPRVAPRGNPHLLVELAARPTSDPEALGSPAGYVVPPGHRLLWPHPRRWTSPFDFSSPGLCATAPRPSVSPLSSAYPSVRAASHTPAERAGYGCRPPVRASLRPLCRGSASALGVSRLQSSLYAAARIVARPPFEDLYIRAFGPRVASMGRRTSLDGPTANSRRRTFTGWTRSPVGCTHSTHPTWDYGTISVPTPRSV